MEVFYACERARDLLAHPSMAQVLCRVIDPALVTLMGSAAFGVQDFSDLDLITPISNVVGGLPAVKVKPCRRWGKVVEATVGGVEVSLHTHPDETTWRVAGSYARAMWARDWFLAGRAAGVEKETLYRGVGVFLTRDYTLTFE